jgi:hypothetical protein
MISYATKTVLLHWNYSYRLPLYYSIRKEARGTRRKKKKYILFISLDDDDEEKEKELAGKASDHLQACPGCPPACPSPGPTLQRPARSGIRRRANLDVPTTSYLSPPPPAFLPRASSSSSSTTASQARSFARCSPRLLATAATTQHTLLPAAAFYLLRRPSPRPPGRRRPRRQRIQPPLCAGPAAGGKQRSGGPPSCRPLGGASTRHDLLVSSWNPPQRSGDFRSPKIKIEMRAPIWELSKPISQSFGGSQPLGLGCSFVPPVAIVNVSNVASR